MAQSTVESTDNLNAGRVKINSNFTELYTTGFTKVSGAGDVYPDEVDHAMRLNAFSGTTKPLEFFHSGETAFPGNPAQLVKTGFGKNNWSVLTTWNMVLNSVQDKWEYGLSDQITACIEAGAEGITFHAVPAGTHFSDTWHEQLQIRANGIEGGGALGPSSGTYIHAKTTLYFRYKSALYDNDEHSWTGGYLRQADPFIHLHTCETKQTENEALRFEANHASTEGLQLYFKKSGGDYFTKTAAAINTVPGVVNFSIWDGSTYQSTARIFAQATALASSNTAPQKLVFRTSETTTGAGVNRMEIMPNGLIVIPSTGTLVVGGSTITNAYILADFQSTTKALAPPRMTKTQRDAMTASAGMVIHQTDNTPGLREYNGTNWVRYTETTD